jgi:hypothetical protein
MPVSEIAPARPVPLLTPARAALICALLIAGTAAILLAMGRLPICSCNTIKLWHGSANDAETSQHILDWYTPSHVIHGFIFYGLFVLLRRWTGLALPLALGLILAILIEGAWEIAENTPAVIDRYRTTTIALGYEGDSVVNSMADMASMIAGFFLAWRLPVAVSIALVVAAELIVGWLIRDNLTLNVIMLLWPMDWIRAWQSGA